MLWPPGSLRRRRKLPGGQRMEFFEGGSGGNFLHKKVTPEKLTLAGDKEEEFKF